MDPDTLSVVLVGLGEDVEQELSRDGGFSVRRLEELHGPVEADALVLAIDDGGPLDALKGARESAPDAAVVVVTQPADAADGTVALHAGAEDHLVRDQLFAALLPRAIRYAAAIRQVRRDLATQDEVTSLPNLRGFAPIAEHHLRMADRTSKPVIFIFVRLDDEPELASSLGRAVADDLARDAASVLLDAVRDSDVPARISTDTMCVLLTGDADGAESAVLSRLVEAMALHDSRREPPRSLALSVGTARYEPGSGAALSDILGSAVRGLTSRSAGT
jgi:diguanylate cyclase (GGDEF)-like protein